ncbi:MAG TPA: preprotein translocase subunit SecE [Sporichthyaceae bacterium]|nr:preprotein translocase subunit SecE [Sporichthyaceae bacterium]
MTDTHSVATPERGGAAGGGRSGGLGRLTGLFARIGLYYRQVVAELRKVIWPTRKELVSYTWIVLIFVAFMIGFVSLCDWGFSKAVLKIFG